jgi:hypothetical protein
LTRPAQIGPARRGFELSPACRSAFFIARWSMVDLLSAIAGPRYAPAVPPVVLNGDHLISDVARDDQHEVATSDQHKAAVQYYLNLSHVLATLAEGAVRSEPFS